MKEEEKIPDSKLELECEKLLDDALSKIVKKYEKFMHQIGILPKNVELTWIKR